MALLPPARQIAARGDANLAGIGFRPDRHCALFARGRLQWLFGDRRRALERGLLRWLLDRRGTMQVGLECCGILSEPLTVDLQILHDPLDVVARLGEWNALDPVHGG